jgi:hypothetical protein
MYSRLFPQARDDLVARERGKRQRLNKFTGRLRHDHVHFEGLPLKRANQFGRLVRGNPARYSDDDSHGLIVDGFDCDGQTDVAIIRPQNVYSI